MSKESEFTLCIVKPDAVANKHQAAILQRVLDEGFEIVALFDVLNEKVGHLSKGGVAIHDIRQFKRIVRQERISIAVVAVPASAAQHVVNLVVGAGVKAVLNFSPGTLTVPPDVKLKSVDLTVSLESLSFFLARGETSDHAEA